MRRTPREQERIRPGEIAIESADLWTLLLSTVRYAMGRRSTAPSTASDLVRKFARHLRPEQIAQIASEIRQETRLGDECDVRTWHALAEWIEG